jgi:hypothetical protein
MENIMMNFRGLEFHGKSFLSYESVEYALDIIRDYNLNALVIHESDFMTDYIYPSSILDPHATWSGAPVRRGENALQNNIYYFRDLLKRTARKGVDVWIEIKEITFPDEIVEKHPEIMKDGVFCPTHPFWTELLIAKYKDLTEWYPGIKGVIVSAGSPEGKTALSQKKCKCERCMSANLSDWYLSLLEPMYRVLAPKGVKLSVREFSYNAGHQKAITDAMNRMPKDVIYCIKVTAHDFYPTFPDNTLITEVNDRPKWIEYDTMGQYYGWGVIPCPMFDDINARFNYALKHGVEGAVLRIEWERINGWHSLKSPNRINMFLAAQASQDIQANPEKAIKKWLLEEGAVYSGNDFAVLKDYFTDVWNIIKGALYINDFVFADSSMIPMTIERAWWSMADKHSLAEWFPARKQDLELDEAKTDAYLREKKTALDKILEWKEKIDALDHTTWITTFLKKTLFLTERYIRFHYYYGRVAVLAGFIQQTMKKGVKVSKEHTGALEDAVKEMEDYTKLLQEWLAASDYPHQVFMLLNPDRSLDWIKGARELLVKAAAL